MNFWIFGMFGFLIVIMYCQSMKTIFLNYQTETTLMLLSSCDAPIVHSMCCGGALIKKAQSA